MSNYLIIDLAFRWSAAPLGSAFGNVQDSRPLQMALINHPDPLHARYFDNLPVNKLTFQIDALEKHSYSALELKVAGSSVSNHKLAKIWKNPPSCNWVKDPGYLRFHDNLRCPVKIQPSSPGTRNPPFPSSKESWNIADSSHNPYEFELKEGRWEVSFQLTVTMRDTTYTFIGDPEMNTGSQGGN